MFCVRGVEREIGFHTSLDAPGQFPELSFSYGYPWENVVMIADPPAISSTNARRGGEAADALRAKCPYGTK
ncbi:MAG: hypothetical protein IKR48_10290 [Kiritimatiellae bacterium]|nr:hypothetical protein [Kiritimatiellia bacterium]